MARAVAFVPRDQALLIGILGVGVFVRLYRLDLTWYFLDQVRDVSTAAGIAAGQSAPLLGPLIGWTSGRLGPLYFYLIAPPFLVVDAPLAGVIFVALSGVLAIALVHRVTSELFGRVAALSASALFAVFPLAVISSRVLWNPALIPLFTVLFMRSLLGVIVDGRSRAIIGVFACLGVLTQLHLTTVSLGLVALIALAVWRPRIRLVDIAIGSAVFLGLYAPYLLHEVTHGFENIRALLGVVNAGERAEGERALFMVVKNLLLLDRQVLDGFVVRDAWPPGFLSAFSTLYSVEAALFALGLVLCASGLARRAREAEGARAVATRRGMGVLLLWLVVPVALLGSRKTALWWYYFDLLYPSQFIVAGIALSCLASTPVASRRARQLLAGGTAAVLLAIVSSQAWFDVGLQRRIDRQAAIVLDVPRLSVAAEGTSFGVLSFLPLGYRERILSALVVDFGLDADAFAQRVHGPVLGLPEENVYLLRRLATRAPHRRADDAAHYLVTEDGNAARSSSVSRHVRIGPYHLIAYRPAVDYAGWSTRTLPSAHRGDLPTGGWQSRVLPGESSSDQRDGEDLVWRGRVRVSPAGGSAPVIVLVSGEGPFDVIPLSTEGGMLALIGQRSWQSPSLYSTTEARLDVRAASGSDHASIVFVVRGAGRVTRVDVYDTGFP